MESTYCSFFQPRVWSKLRTCLVFSIKPWTSIIQYENAWPRLQFNKKWVVSNSPPSWLASGRWGQDCMLWIKGFSKSQLLELWNLFKPIIGITFSYRNIVQTKQNPSNQHNASRNYLESVWLIYADSYSQIKPLSCDPLVMFNTLLFYALLWSSDFHNLYGSYYHEALKKGWRIPTTKWPWRPSFATRRGCNPLALVSPVSQLVSCCLSYKVTVTSESDKRKMAGQSKFAHSGGSSVQNFLWSRVPSFDQVQVLPKSGFKYIYEQSLDPIRKKKTGDPMDTSGVQMGQFLVLMKKTRWNTSGCTLNYGLSLERHPAHSRRSLHD